MTSYEARIIEGPHLFVRNLVTLVVRDGDRFLKSDGTWEYAEEGAVPEGIGVAFPPGAVEAIAVAIQEWQGHVSHADTEAKVLREWLAVERDRVERIMFPQP